MRVHDSQNIRCQVEIIYYFSIPFLITINKKPTKAAMVQWYYIHQNMKCIWHRTNNLQCQHAQSRNRQKGKE